VNFELLIPLFVKSFAFPMHVNQVVFVEDVKQEVKRYFALKTKKAKAKIH
jgi:hypothetical protein